MNYLKGPIDKYINVTHFDSHKIGNREKQCNNEKQDLIEPVEKENTMANKSKTTNSKWIAKSLAEIREGTSNLSYHLKRELEKLNLIEPVFVKIEGRGRPIKTHVVTGAGRKFLGLSTRWNRDIAT